MSLCTITLEDMEFKASHGCYDLEKKVGGRFVVRLSVEAEIGQAARRDDVSQTVNYLDVYDEVKRQMSLTSDIIENVAERILDGVLGRFENVRSATVTVSKLAPPVGGKVGRVSVTMSK